MGQNPHNRALPSSILILGSGKIGRMIARFLSETGEYRVRVGDHDTNALERLKGLTNVEPVHLDASASAELHAAMEGCDRVISSLSFHYNRVVAEAALQTGLHYFDLTEDIETTEAVRRVAAQAASQQVFMPQCGLAPGFVSIVAHELTQSFDKLDTVQMRVGALPQFPTGSLRYNLTWSTDGLINEYCNPCDCIHEGRRMEVLPLEGLEQFSLDGVRYEAFNTSGGLGSLCETLDTQVRELNYKTIRYLGHRDQINLLVNELRLSEKRELLKQILEDAIPVTFQDVVIVFCTVTGERKGQLVKISDARKIYSQTIHDEIWSAIQITTAAGVCAVVDMHAQGVLHGTGFIPQEKIRLSDFLTNRFGKYYDCSGTTRYSQMNDARGSH